MSDDNAVKKLEKYKENVRENVTVLLKKTFPEKILELNELLESEKLSIKRLETIHVPIDVQPLVPPTAGNETGGTTSGTVPSTGDLTKRFMQWYAFKVVLPPEGRVGCNQHILELLRMVQKLDFELHQHTASLNITITYLVPKVEDGNNFGVEIQEETVKMIKELENDLNSFWSNFNGFSGYDKDRASFASDICKDPHLDDNREGIRYLDEKAFLFLVRVVTFIRDAYGKMHDVINKNIEKIRKPRTSNAANLF